MYRLRSVHLLNLEKIQRRLAWPLRKDDTQYLLKSESFFYYYYYSTTVLLLVSKRVERDGRRRSRRAARSRGVARADASVFRGYHLVLRNVHTFWTDAIEEEEEEETNEYLMYTCTLNVIQYCNNNT